MVDKEKRLLGFYTVEAALVFGLILGVLEALLLEAFWLHDRTILYSLPYYYLEIEDQDNREPLLLKDLKNELLLFQVQQVIFEEEGGKEKCTIRVKLNFPGGRNARALLGLASEETLTITVSSNIDAVTVLRAAHGLIWR